MVQTRLLILLTLSIKIFITEGQGRHHHTPKSHSHNINGILNHLQKHDQIDYCKIKNPCHNGGQCNVDMYGLIRCSCAEGFTGDVCLVSCNDIVASCPDGFEMWPPVSGKCYHIRYDSTIKNFMQAQRYCRDLHIHTSLWEPKSQEELDNIGLYLTDSGSYWTGIFDVYDEGSLINVGTGTSFPSSLVNDTPNESLNCVFFATGLGLQYGHCEASRQIVFELLNPCDLPDVSVLPVPVPGMYGK